MDVNLNLFSNFTFAQPTRHHPTSSTSSTIDPDEVSPSSSRSSSPPPLSPTSLPTSRPTSTSNPTSNTLTPSVSITDLTTHFSRSTIHPVPSQPLCARLASQPSQLRRRSRRDACDPTRLHGHLDLLVRRLMQEGAIDVDASHPSELRASSHNDEVIMETDDDDSWVRELAPSKLTAASSRRPSRNAVQKQVKMRRRRNS